MTSLISANSQNLRRIKQRKGVLGECVFEWILVHLQIGVTAL